MRVPKYVMKIIERRAKAAIAAREADIALCEWLDAKGVLDEVELYDVYGGAEMYVNPWESAKRVLKAIKEAEHE